MMIKPMKRGVILAVMLVAFLVLPLSAQTGSSLGSPGQATIDGRTWLTFTGAGGLRILALAPFPDEARQRLERTVSVIATWPTIRISELRAESSKGVDDYILSFTALRHEGRDYSANVPGGLRLRYDGALMYDFRVRSGDYFVRVRGVLMDEASLLSEIAKAVQDPGAYVAERDPAWLALRLEQLDKANTQQDRRLDQLDSRTVEINRRLTQKTEETSALLESRSLELRSLVQSRSTELQTRIASVEADFDARLEVLRKEAAEDRIALEARLAANQALFESLAGTLRLALASEMNKGLFGSPKPLDSMVLDHVLALKASSPETDRAAALESAKAAELKPKAKEIDIIFRVWFGE